MRLGTKLKTAFGKHHGPDEDCILSHASREARARSYEAARQHFIVQCDREERARQKRLERKQNHRTNLRMSFYLFILMFALVWVFQYADEICNWWSVQIHEATVWLMGG